MTQIRTGSSCRVSINGTSLRGTYVSTFVPNNGLSVLIGSGTGGSIRKGDFWDSSASGTIAGLNIPDLETGDLLIAKINGASTASQFIVNKAEGGGGGGDLLSTNNLSDVANAATARTNLGAQGLVITETVLVDGAIIDIAQQNNTLATSRTVITFTISNTSTFIYLTITLTGTALVLTLPANSLCVSDGTASGDNTCSLSGVSGDVYEIAIKKRGSTYSVVSKNFGQ